jgi:hypothetical protein
MMKVAGRDEAWRLLEVVARMAVGSTRLVVRLDEGGSAARCLIWPCTKRRWFGAATERIKPACFSLGSGGWQLCSRWWRWATTAAGRDKEQVGS